jgi:CDP-glycerol glycerophosphotransferase (TagB/SpsB family)
MKGVALNPYSQIHYIDHLAPISILMGIPLLFLDEQDYQLGKKYYPEVDAKLEEYAEVTPEYLISQYDVLFMSDLWDRKSFHEKFQPLESKYQKKLRHVHCPHGYSDKGFYLKKCAQEDILLIYGKNMWDMLKRYDVEKDLNQYVMVGNYRFTYFKKHLAFFRKVVLDEIEKHFRKKQKTILYAPTWLDLEESTTFFDTSEYLFKNLPSHFNMIVKLHPRLELDDAVKYYEILGKYENQPNILFIKDFPLVFPLLDYVDIYIGDTSSIGYDFLAFDKPMYFLNKLKKDLFLYQCGVEVFPEDFLRLYSIIENDKKSFSDVRKQVYSYTFGEEKSFEQIKEEIFTALT